jgi:hypothetical protein
MIIMSRTTLGDIDRKIDTGFDATHTFMRALGKRNQTGFEATHALVGELNSREEARTGKVINEIRKNSANPKKSWGLLILVIAIGIAIAALSYWFVIQSNLCHLGGLWREVVQRDAVGNIIPGSYTFELVEGAKAIWGALSVAMGAAVAALLHAIIPWYREEV